MDSLVSADDLRARLDQELEALSETEDALCVTRGGRVVAVVLDSDHYAGLLERLDYLEDSLAALTVRAERDSSVPWSEVREPRF